MASDLTWTCVGQDSFLIKLVVYRDCNGDFLTSTPVIFTNPNTNAEITRLNTNPGTPVDVTPTCKVSCTRCQRPDCYYPYGIHRYTMQGIVKLNAAGSVCNVKMSWEQCCRSTAINTGAAGADFYTEATLNRCLNPCDNSPTFTNLPIAILCNGQDFTFCHGVQDIDVNNVGGLADSITYEWDQPLSAPNTPVSYTGGYSFNKPINFWGFPDAELPFPKGFHLDNESCGSIQFRPVKNEQTIMVVKVNEFRDGVKIAELRRNMYIIVMTCPVNNIPTITTAGNIRSKSVCPGDTVSFEFFTNDADSSDTVTISWNNTPPGAVFSNTNGKEIHAKGQLKWVPEEAHASSLPYTFAITAKDQHCPVRGAFTQAYQIIVNPLPQANIIVTDSCPKCHTFWFLAQRIQGSGPSYLWKGENFNFTPNIGSLVWHKFSQPGIYPYTMTMTAGGCSKTYYDTVKIDTFSAVNNQILQSSLFKIYPNPASDYVHIVYLGLTEWKGRLLLYDRNSKLVYSRNIYFNQVKTEFTLPLNGYKSGLYLLKLENSTSTVLLKLLVQ